MRKALSIAAVFALAGAALSTVLSGYMTIPDYGMVYSVPLTGAANLPQFTFLVSDSDAINGVARSFKVALNAECVGSSNPLLSNAALSFAQNQAGATNYSTSAFAYDDSAAIAAAETPVLAAGASSMAYFVTANATNSFVFGATDNNVTIVPGQYMLAIASSNPLFLSGCSNVVFRVNGQWAGFVNTPVYNPKGGNLSPNGYPTLQLADGEYEATLELIPSLFYQTGPLTGVNSQLPVNIAPGAESVSAADLTSSLASIDFTMSSFTAMWTRSLVATETTIVTNAATSSFTVPVQQNMYFGARLSINRPAAQPVVTSTVTDCTATVTPTSTTGAAAGIRAFSMLAMMPLALLAFMSVRV